ncbi:MAG: hypothetical protein IPH72_32585 [Sandaracinaceae bacterium]|nr:hypothetical protein [Sandaracinaceae bacterium]
METSTPSSAPSQERPLDTPLDLPPTYLALSRTEASIAFPDSRVRVLVHPHAG